jgi:hypothetical protein
MNDDANGLFDERGYLKPGRRLRDDYFDKPSQARVWNYLLGGKDNYAVDRAVGDAMLAAYPDYSYMARQARRFLARAVRFVAAECGVRQFLDVGCGLPLNHDQEAVHEIAQGIDPSARIVYVDNDPIVFAHAQALLTSRVPGGGVIDYIEADARDGNVIVAAAAATLDFEQPAAVILLGVLGALEYDEAIEVVRMLMNVVPSGSYLVFADGSDTGPEVRKAVDSTSYYQVRSAEQVARYFEGLELVEPGVVSLSLWRPDDVEVGAPRPVDGFGAVARKP